MVLEQRGEAPAGVGEIPEPLEEVLPRQFGKYTLLRKLASGGMAELYLALHRSVAGFEKLVVIKRILPQMTQDQAFIDMLLHEARIAATLSHPNIVQTFDVGQVDGTFFIAMEHIHGEDIRTIVRGMRKKDVTEFPLAHALTIVLGVCAGLAYAHEKRGLDGQLLHIVHRDISPQNIVITFTGDVKVVDFGIAKSEHFVEEQKGGQLKGKVPYMSPEQAAGNEIDWRSDIFAAGVILFELTTGRRLFKGANEFETLKLITEREYPLPSDIAPNYPLGLERVVMKALAKDRDKRYQSAREMQSDLESFVRQERIAASTVSLSKWMEMLFAEKLAQQNEALHDIKQLADAIAAQQPAPESSSPFVSGMTGVFPAVDMTTQPGSASGAVATIVPEKKRSAVGLVFGAFALVAAAGGGMYYFTHQKQLPAAPPVVVETATPVVDAKGILKVTSDPPGAAIWMDGDLRSDVTPATIDNLPIGREIKVKLSLDGFESYKEAITITAAGDTKNIDAKMKTGSVTVTLNIVPEPTVWVDTKPWKASPKKITGLSADEEHKVVVSASGYVPKTFTFIGKQGETKNLEAKLMKGDPNAIAAAEKAASEKNPPPEKTATPTAASGPGTVRVNAKGGYCNVTINGASVGVTPTGGSVSSGTARVTCKPDSGPAMTQTVPVEAGQTARVIFQIPQ
ncbi:MAG: protein kinase [Polyangiaceae bacterium]